MPDNLKTNIIYSKIVTAITEEQSKIVGRDLAQKIALSVNGLNYSNGEYTVTSDPVIVLEELVKKYSILFGEISVGVSHDAVKKLGISADTTISLPKVLS